MNRSASIKERREYQLRNWSVPVALVLLVVLSSGALRAAAAESGSASPPPIAVTNHRASNPHLEFAPEVERVLDTHGALGARAYLSFSNGVVGEESSAENPQRNRQLHRDLRLQTIEGEQEWTGVDLQIAPATEAMWNTPPDQLIAALADDLAPPLPTMQVIPGVWFFQTRDGNYGLLRIVGFVEPGPGFRAMKVVYKLARLIDGQRHASDTENIFLIRLKDEVPGVITERAASLDLPMFDRIRKFVDGAPQFDFDFHGENFSFYGPTVQLDGPATSARAEVVTIPMPVAAHNPPGSWDDLAYHLRSANCFYILWGQGPTTMRSNRLYGPFRGDPVKVLGLPVTSSSQP